MRSTEWKVGVLFLVIETQTEWAHQWGKLFSHHHRKLSSTRTKLSQRKSLQQHHNFTSINEWESSHFPSALHVSRSILKLWPVFLFVHIWQNVHCISPGVDVPGCGRYGDKVLFAVSSYHNLPVLKSMYFSALQWAWAIWHGKRKITVYRKVRCDYECRHWVNGFIICNVLTHKVEPNIFGWKIFHSFH